MNEFYKPDPTYPSLVCLGSPIKPFSLYDAILRATYIPYTLGYVTNEKGQIITVDPEDILRNFVSSLKGKDLTGIAEEIKRTIYILQDRKVTKYGSQDNECIVLNLKYQSPVVVESYYNLMALYDDKEIPPSFLTSFSKDHAFIKFLDNNL